MSAADGVVRRRVKSELRETGLNLLDASVLRAALMNRWLFMPVAMRKSPLVASRKSPPLD
jgi:hypothetical protein